MASHPAIEIADAIVAKINAAELSQPVVAVRRYLVRFDRVELDGRVASVVPAEREDELHTRAEVARTIKIDVGLQTKWTKAPTDAELDALLLLMDELLALFEFGAIVFDGETDDAKNTHIHHRLLYDPDTLSDKRVFTSIATLTYAYADAVRSGA